MPAYLWLNADAGSRLQPSPRTVPDSCDYPVAGARSESRAKLRDVAQHRDARLVVSLHFLKQDVEIFPVEPRWQDFLEHLHVRPAGMGVSTDMFQKDAYEGDLSFLSYVSTSHLRLLLVREQGRLGNTPHCSRGIVGSPPRRDACLLL